jgi:flagellar biosynthesis GTPase FlhF
VGGTIFISYRRGQDAGFAGRLFDRLERTFRRKALFMDVDSIAPGQDFVSILETRVAECEVLLALIGRGWLIATDEAGRRRLDNPEDFVRIEIATALAQEKRVIPVLIDGVPMPRSEDVPEILRPLVRRQATCLSHDRFKADSDRLIRALKQVLEAAKTARQENEAQQEARQQVPSPAQDGMSRSQEGPSTPRPRERARAEKARKRQAAEEQQEALRRQREQDEAQKRAAAESRQVAEQQQREAQQRREQDEARRARATQPAGYPAGQACVQVREAEAGAVDLDTLEVCISELRDSIEEHLDPRLAGEGANVWKTNYVWFRPHSPRLEGSALLFDLQPAVTWHLRAYAKYVLRLRDAQGARGEVRLTWVPIRLPSQAPPRLQSL